MKQVNRQEGAFGRRGFLYAAGAAFVGAKWGPSALAQTTEPAVSMNIIEFEETLIRLRDQNYRHPKIDIVKTGFRPVGGKVADMAVAHHDGRYHFFYIERRLQEGTPFYPGHEAYFGHASTPDFFEWEVHDPALWIRPDTWEDGHLWAPCIIRRGDQYVMAYTGVSRKISQNIGLAFSRDLMRWTRAEWNPISPCKDAEWAFWRADSIASCRDPDMFEHEGRVYMTYTANTKTGASCIALTSSADLKSWKDHGPILIGPSSGYEPRMAGGHPQGSLESARMFHKKGHWCLSVKASIRNEKIRSWLFESDRMDRFDFQKRREFWPGAGGIEIVKERGDRMLVATFLDGYIRFGEIDWSAAQPVGRYVETREQLAAWQ